MKFAWPIYEVHVYYDTTFGLSIIGGGESKSLNSPLNSYGYYFSHDGVFYGYATAMGSTNTQDPFEVLEPGELFTSRVPAEGILKVQNAVSAEELPGFFSNAEDRACERWSWACEDDNEDPIPDDDNGCWLFCP